MVRVEAVRRWRSLIRYARPPPWPSLRPPARPRRPHPPAPIPAPLIKTNIRSAYPSIAISIGRFLGRPAISYYDATNNRLRFVLCGNAACSGPCGVGSQNICSTVDAGGRYSSITIGNDGNPIISYRGSDQMLHVAAGETPGLGSCGGGVTCTPVDLTPQTGLHTSITIAPDGLPTIAYGTFGARQE